jgi:hypothetical protein
MARPGPIARTGIMLAERHAAGPSKSGFLVSIQYSPTAMTQLSPADMVITIVQLSLFAEANSSISRPLVSNPTATGCSA